MRRKAKNAFADYPVFQPASQTQPLIAHDVKPEPVCSIEDCYVVHLSARDSVRVLEMLENPPEPNEAALQAARLFMKNYG